MHSNWTDEHCQEKPNFINRDTHDVWTVDTPLSCFRLQMSMINESVFNIFSLDKLQYKNATVGITYQKKLLLKLRFGNMTSPLDWIGTNVIMYVVTTYTIPMLTT